MSIAVSISSSDKMMKGQFVSRVRRAIFGRGAKDRERTPARIPLDAFFDTIRSIRRRNGTLALTPTITGYSWMGVNRATHALFPDRVLEIPHGGVHAYISPELAEICRYLASAQFDEIVLSGFPESFEFMATRLRQHGVKVACIFHGPVSEFGLSPWQAPAFESILRLVREGVIAKLACIKKGLPETLAKIAGLKASHLIIPTRLSPQPRHTIERAAGPLHIGVLAHNMYRKNVHTQLLAALMIDGATVHLMGDPPVGFWKCDHRVIRHPAIMPHADFLDLLGQMHLNLHLSFSESWGQLTAESLAMGVPCIIANHSGILDFDPFLHATLLSHNFDDPWALSKDVERVIAQSNGLSARCRHYVGVLNERADVLLAQFLGR